MKSQKIKALSSFYQRLEEVSHLRATLRLLEFDASVSLPPLGQEQRAKQISFIEAELHTRLTNTEFKLLVEELNQTPSNLSDIDRCNVQKIHRQIKRQESLPADLVRRLAELRSTTHAKWIIARKNNTYGSVLDVFTELVSATKEKANLLEDGDTPYERLARYYEPDTDIVETLSHLKQLHDLSLKLRHSGSLKQRDSGVSLLYLSEEQQQRLSAFVFNLLGFTPDSAILTTSEHPFQTTLGPFDVRVTTRFTGSDPLESLFATLHECGHAMYQQLRPTDWYGTPSGEAASFSIDESQARFWENIFGRSYGFMSLLAKFIRDDLGVLVEEESLLEYCRSIYSWPIRVEADEVHYLSHIWLRAETEKALIEGDISTADLPQAWNERYTSYFGNSPSNDREGVLQDIHWYAGMFGYFPSYALGSEYSARLASVCEPLQVLESERCQERHIQELRAWLQTRVGAYGALIPSEQIITSASGTPFSLDIMERYFISRYSA